MDHQDGLMLALAFCQIAADNVLQSVREEVPLQVVGVEYHASDGGLSCGLVLLQNITNTWYAFFQVSDQ